MICATHRLRSGSFVEPLLEDLGEIDLDGIQWSSSGRKRTWARFMEPEWVNALMEQCNQKGVPFFFKQWGGVRKKQAGT